MSFGILQHRDIKINWVAELKIFSVPSAVIIGSAK